MKFYYNRKYTIIDLEVKDKVFLKLYKEYSIPIVTSYKLYQQRVRLFEILQKISKLAFKLDIPNNQKIYPIVSIQQIKLALRKPDLYYRPILDFLEAVYIEGDTDQNKLYELEKVIKKRNTPKGYVKYLVRQKGYRPEYNKQKSAKEIENEKDLVKDFERYEKEE